MTLVKDVRAGFIQGATTMGFCNKGERSGSTPNMTRQGENL